jgi:NADH dehydrogenase
MEDIVVVGGGIAGLETVLRLERKFDQTIKLVEPREKMLFYPALHKVIEGEEPGKTVIDLDKKFSDRDIEHIKQEMTGLDKESNCLKIGGDSIEFSKLVLAFGAETNYFGVDESSCYCLRSLEDAKEIRNKIENGIEKAVVVGGGATGVEATASLLEATREFGFDVTLVQAEEDILPFNVPSLRGKAEKLLSKKGAEIRKQERAVEVGEDYVKLSSGEEIDSDLTVWSAGIRKKDVIEEMDLASSERGIKVEDSMKVKGEEDIYAVGDAASYDGKEARAYFALSEAKTAAKNIKAEEKDGKTVENSFYWDPQVIYLGGLQSGMEIFGRSFTGLMPHIVREYFVDGRYLFLRRNII